MARFLVPQQINDAKAEAAKHEEDARVLQAKKSDLESNAVAVREAKTGEAETLEQERQRLAEELAAKIGDLDANADNVRRRAEELCQETDDLAQREQALEAEHAVFAETKPTLEKTLTKKERDTAGADRVRRRFLEAFNSVGGEEQ